MDGGAIRLCFLQLLGNLRGAEALHTPCEDLTDNGCGFNPAAVMDCGMGLSNIVSRVHSINGHCNVEGAKGKGMHAAIRVNVRGEASAAAGARRRTAARRRKRR